MALWEGSTKSPMRHMSLARKMLIWGGVQRSVSSCTRKQSNNVFNIEIFLGFSEQSAISWQVVIKMIEIWRFWTVRRKNIGFPTSFPASPAHFSHQRQHLFARQPQIGQRKQRHDLPGVLREFAIAGHGIRELFLHHPERMLDNGASPDSIRLKVFCSSVSSPPAGFLVGVRTETPSSVSKCLMV